MMKVFSKVGSKKRQANVSRLMFDSVHSVQSMREYNFINRLTALFLLTTLLPPLIFFGNQQKVSAQSSLPSAQINAPLAAPPEPFVFSSSNSFSTAALSSLTTLNASVANGYTAVADWLNPPLPEGFGNAAAATTLFNRISSGISSFAAPLLFFLPSSSSSSAKTSTTNPSVANAPLLTAQATVKFDFDGDGKADIARWQRASTEWKVKNSSNGSFSTNLIGSVSSVIAPADYDGDMKTDAAVFNASTGTWTIKHSSNGTTQTTTGFGQTGDKPVSGDYDGDGLADAAVWRPSNGTWYVKQSTNGATVTLQFGASSDIPVAGNYDGDSQMDYAVFRPSNGVWYVWVRAVNTFSGFQWGNSLDLPVPADYDGDGKTDYAINRGGQWWYCKSSTNNSQYGVLVWGNHRDQPVPADYDGDGKADLSVWRPTTGEWYILKSSDGSYTTNTLGATGDVAVEAAYLKQIGGEVFGSDLAKARLAPKNATGGGNLYSRNFSWGRQLVGLAGRTGLDVGLGISYNSLVWTKQGSTMVFDADSSNISSPGFRLGFPTIEPSYYDSITKQFAYLMVTPSGARVEFKQVAASNIYETADSAYTQLKTVGAIYPNDPVENITLTVTGTNGTQLNYQWKAGAFRPLQIKDSNGNFMTMSYDDFGLLRSVTDTLGRIVNINYDSVNQPTSITQSWKDNNGAGATQTHTYATFDYTYSLINPSFGAGITYIYGPQGSTERLLQRITYADGSSTRFDYNTYGQVYQVSNYAADNHELNHTRVNLSNSEIAAGQIDCPRFTETRNYAENFNNGQETIVTNSITENQSYNVGGMNGTGTLLQVSMTGHPHQAISKTFVGATGWQEGLPIATEDWADGTRQRWTWTNWTQDDPTKTYIVNPRVVETKVGDAINTKRTMVEYYPTSEGSPVALYGLVKEVKVYDTNQTTILKRATSEYNLSSAYTTRRIIGLPSKSELFDENGFLTAKATYNYDEENFDQEPEQNISPINHDTTNFGTSFIIGRGNQTRATRWDVNFPDNLSQAVVSKVRYDVAGSPVAQIDALSRKVKINYTDSFNDNQTRNSFAYPTKLTDPAGNFSLVKYRFDIGANVWAKSPAPQNQTSGKMTERLFDAIGRLSKETILNSGAYTRYEYPTNQIQAKIFTTITDTNSNGADTADEVLAESWADGAGRVRQSRTELPNSTGGFSGQLTEYDILGRVKRSTVPTEVNASWQPAGDDASRGWLWSSQDYDWKGRVIRTTNTDGTTQEMSYEGCGCAGGEIVTVQGEEIVERDWQGNPTNTLGRRTQKIYSDILGRNYKTEVYNWNGTGLPYATTINTFNGRDQVTLSRQYEGAEGSGVFQETTMNYDGHGRLKTQHLPEQDAGKATTFDYNSDDTLEKKTDARGASENYTYNERGLLSQVSYTVPSDIQSLYPYINGIWNLRNTITNGLGVGGGNFDSNVEIIASKQVTNNGITTFLELTRYTGGQITRTPDGNPGEELLRFQMTETEVLNAYNSTQLYLQVVNPSSDKMSEKIKVGGGSQAPSVWFGSGNIHGIPQTPTVTYQYDALGNRISMTDGVGQIIYAYDELSQLKSENRQFNDITNFSAEDGKFKLSYEYTLFGSLKSLTDPFGAKINYNFNKIGQITSITGDIAYAGITTYASELSYRAWGAGKHIKYGNNNTLDIDYNSRQNPQKYDLLNTSGTRLMGADYKYYDDGALQFVDDLSEERLDRKYTFDKVGRVTQAVSGYQANGSPNPNNSTTGPYSISYGYNAFDNLTSKNNGYWYANNSANNSQTYINNRVQGPDWAYDEDGRPIRAELMPASSNRPPRIGTYKYDAAGRVINFDDKLDGDGYPVIPSPNFKHYIRSSVLGGEVVSEVSSGALPELNGTKLSTFIFFEGSVIAEQTDTSPGGNIGSELINWIQKDPAETSSYANAKQWALDPQGIATEAPNYANLNQYPDYYSQRFNSYNYGRSYNPWEGTGVNSPNSNGAGGGIPGSPMTCVYLGASLPCGTVPGGAIQCPNNDCGPRLIQGSLRPIVYAGGWGAWAPVRRTASSGRTAAFNRSTPPTLTHRKTTKEVAAKGRAIAATGIFDNEEEFALSEQKFFIVGFSDNQSKQINEQVKFMANSEDCSKAFEAAGLTSVNSMIFNGGLTILHYKLLDSSTNNSKWGGNESLRTGMRDKYEKKLYTNDVTPVGPQNGSYYSSFNDRAFTGWDDTVPRVIVHGLMHSGGANGEDGPLPGGKHARKREHDLSQMNLAKYNQIMSDCIKQSGWFW